MAQRFNRPPHPEAPFHADRVADSAPPTRDELGAFSWRMRERAQRRSLAFAVAMTVAGTLVLATRHESGVAAFLNARIESIDLALYALAVVAVVIWGYTLFRLLDPIFSDWLGARADLEVIAEEAPEVKRVLVSTALINQAATGYMRALREDVDRELRAGDLRAMRQYLRQIKNPNTAGDLEGPPTRPEEDWDRGYTVWSEHSYRFFLDEEDTLDYIEFIDGDLGGVAIFFGRPGEGRFPYEVTNCPQEIWQHYETREDLEERIDEELEEVLDVFGGWGQALVPYY